MASLRVVVLLSRTLQRVMQLVTRELLQEVVVEKILMNVVESQ
jgi:hypothetical protein